MRHKSKLMNTARLAVTATLVAATFAAATPASATGTSATGTSPDPYLGQAALFSALASAAITAPASTFIGGYSGAGAAFTSDGGTNWDTEVHRLGGDGPAVAGASTALSDAYASLLGLGIAVTAKSLPLDFPAKDLCPGTYHSDAAIVDSGNLTFDAHGHPDAVFIIQTDAAINTAAGTHMYLKHGAKASNIYWVSAAATTLGAASTFDGNIISLAAITVGAGSTIYGRALSVTAAITLDNTTIDSSPDAGERLSSHAH